MKKNTRRILFGSTLAAGALTAAGATSLALTNKLVRLALDRELPKRIKGSNMSISGSDIKRDELEYHAKAVRKLESRSHELVEITSRDDERLVGHLYTVDGARRTLLAMHGWRSSWSGDFAFIADFWFSEGCNVLFAEQNPNDHQTPDFLFKALDVAVGVNAEGPQKALDIANILIEKYPDFEMTPMAMFIKGFVYENMIGDLQNAEMTYRQFIERYPNNPMVEDVKSTLENLGLTPEELIRKFEEAN